MLLKPTHFVPASMVALPLALMVSVLVPTVSAAGQKSGEAVHTPAPTQLHDEISRLASAAKGVVGISAWRLDGRGPRVSMNQDQFFPLASTFKVAVAGAILAKVDRGELTLDRLIPVDQNKYSPSAVIARELIHPGVSLSIHNLLELMITHSDNTATDVLTELAGGPAGATAWLRTQGITDQRIDRDTNGLLRDFYGIPPGGRFEDAFEKAVNADPSKAERASRPLPSFDEDPRDTSTPLAMATVLTRIFSGKALKPATTKVLTDIMERTKTGQGRLKGILPAGTVVARKTGTLGGTVNDVGVITLPAGAGQVVIAVYIKKSEAPVAVRERTIAEIARAVYDFYLFSAPRR